MGHTLGRVSANGRRECALVLNRKLCHDRLIHRRHRGGDTGQDGAPRPRPVRNARAACASAHGRRNRRLRVEVGLRRRLPPARTRPPPQRVHWHRRTDAVCRSCHRGLRRAGLPEPCIARLAAVCNHCGVRAAWIRGWLRVRVRPQIYRRNKPRLAAASSADGCYDAGDHFRHDDAGEHGHMAHWIERRDSRERAGNHGGALDGGGGPIDGGRRLRFLKGRSRGTRAPSLESDPAPDPAQCARRPPHQPRRRAAAVQHRLHGGVLHHAVCVAEAHVLPVRHPHYSASVVVARDRRGHPLPRIYAALRRKLPMVVACVAHGRIRGGVCRRLLRHFFLQGLGASASRWMAGGGHVLLIHGPRINVRILRSWCGLMGERGVVRQRALPLTESRMTRPHKAAGEQAEARHSERNQWAAC
mmetsp:Transcript_6361/g.25686  ORF Transcript_6361/g.25686 Transcript_6361/m.25686 type:complete len:415 (-) Transcript_6361:116-1360(-)